MVTGSMTRRSTPLPPIESVNLTLSGDDAHNFIAFLKATKTLQAENGEWRCALAYEYSKTSRGSGIITKILNALGA